jgi:signal transduction histidine kinase
MKNDKFKHALLLLFCLVFNSLVAQNQKYFSQHLTQSEGLPQNSINKLLFTNYGFLWMATEDGLVRYDGVNFKVFSMFSQSIIKNDRFKSIIKDKNDVVYVYNSIGKQYIINENKLSINDLSPSFYHLNGLHPSNNKFNSVLQKSNPFKLAPLPFHVMAVNDSLMLASRAKSIVLFKGNKIIDTLKFMHKQLASFFIWNNNYFIFSKDGVIYKIEISNKYKLSLIKITSFNKDARLLYKVFFKHSNQVFVTHNNIVYKLNLEKRQFILEPIYTSISKEEIISDIDVHEEHGIVAIGTLTNGIYLLRPNHFSYMRNKLNAPNYNQSGQHFAFTLYSDSLIVTAQKQIFNGEYCQTLIDFNKPLSQEVIDEHNGYIYFAKQGDIISYHPPTKIFKNVVKTTSGDVSVISHWGDTLFCADQRYLYITHHNKIITKYAHSNAKNQVRINDVLKISDTIYLATSSGLLVYNQKQNNLKKYREDLSIRSLSIYENNIFLCTFGNGIVVFDKHKFYQLNYDALGLLSKSHVTLSDSMGRFWIGTNNGLYVMCYLDVLRRIKDTSYTINYTKYDKQNGLLSAEFNGGKKPSAIVDKNGLFYFSTMSGIVYFNPYVVSKIYKNVPIFIDEFKINDRPFLYDGKEINISRDESKSLINIHFATPYWKNKENEVLFYNVEGPLKFGGRISLSNPVINISYLPSGQYKILIFKTNGFDDQIQQIEFTVNIQKQYYEFWWFWIFVVTLLASLIILSVYLYNLSLLKQKQMLESVVKRRTQDLEISNQMLLASEGELKQTVAVKSKLVSIISHDIVTPLKFMSMVTQSNLDKEPDIKGLLTDVQITTGRLYQNAQNILNWIKYQDKRITTVYEAVSLYALVQDVGDLLRHATQINQNVFINDIDPDVIIKTDKTIMVILLQNIIANSVKYSKQSQIKVSYSGIGHSHLIEIADTGQGIAPQILHQITQTLTGTYNKQEISKEIDSSNTGLGYVIISELSKLIEVTIKLESTVGHGTKVTLYWKGYD